MTSLRRPPPVAIRAAKVADIRAIVAVVNAAFAIETFVEGARTDEADILERMRRGDLVVAEDDGGDVVACVHIERRDEHGFFSMLAVAPTRQGVGLGRMMVAHVEDQCRRLGCRDLTITVLSLRRELLPFYQKQGYVQTGTQPFHTAQPLKDGTECHTIIMRKEL